MARAAEWTAFVEAAKDFAVIAAAIGIVAGFLAWLLRPLIKEAIRKALAPELEALGAATTSANRCAERWERITESLEDLEDVAEEAITLARDNREWMIEFSTLLDTWGPVKDADRRHPPSVPRYPDRRRNRRSSGRTGEGPRFADPPGPGPERME